MIMINSVPLQSLPSAIVLLIAEPLEHTSSNYPTITATTSTGDHCCSCSSGFEGKVSKNTYPSERVDMKE